MATRTLVLMRHAKSDWSGDEPDLQRPIGKRGRLQAAEAGHWLSRNLPDLDLVISSHATRARTTWEQAATQYEGRPVVATDERIHTAYDEDLLDVLHQLDDGISSALLIGHNPGLDELVTRLSGAQVEMVTSALAVLRFGGTWRELAAGTCDLVAYGRPPD